MTNCGWMGGALSVLLVTATVGCGSTRNLSPVKKVSGVDTRAEGVSPPSTRPAAGNVPAPRDPSSSMSSQQPLHGASAPPSGTSGGRISTEAGVGVGGASTWVEYAALQGDVLAFIQELGPRAGHRTIGCLPFYSRDPTSTLRPSYPSLLGEQLADQIAQSLPNYGYRGSSLPLGPDLLAMRVAGANLSRDGLGEVAGISQHGRRFGVDILVFGEFVRTGNEVRGDMYAWDVAANVAVARRTLSFGAGGREAAHFIQPSPWDPASGLGAQDTVSSFTGELRALTQTLARTLVERGRLSDGEGQVYVAPADTSQFVEEIAELRVAQRILGREWNRRHQASMQSGRPLDEDTPPPPVGSRRFGSLRELETFVLTQDERLMTTSNARLCVQLSRWLAEGLQGELGGSLGVVQDLHFPRPADTQLVEGVLATGGLANNAQARDKLLDQDVAFVVQLFLERWGDEFTLRATAYGLQDGSILASASEAVQPRWREAMNQELGL